MRHILEGEDVELAEEFENSYVKVQPILETDGNIFENGESCDYFAYQSD